MTAVELREIRKALQTRLDELERIKTTCDHCEHFGVAPHCNKFGIVPEDFRRTEGACPDWRFDGVPF